MAHIQASKTKPDYDVIVVGSGAAGGQTAYTLAMEGVKVLMLEAGRNYDPATETPMFNTPEQAPLRAMSTPDKPFGYYDATIDGGWEMPDEPYTNASSEPGREFKWWRSRMLGGRTNHWGRIALRNGPYDFKPYSRDGLGFDWPISYEDVAPYYDKVELLIGVYGTNENLENTPNSSDGILLRPPKARAAELLMHRAGQQLGIPVVPVHRAVLSERLDSKRIPGRLHPDNPRAAAILADEMSRRAACFWATPCNRGCSIKANYQSTTVHLPPALATGNLDIITDAMVASIVTDHTGKARGVSFIDKKTGRDFQIKARIVVLAASAMESVRVLLNSRTAQHRDGVGNSSGLLGKYIMDSVGAKLGGRVPMLENLPPHNEEGAGDGAHIYSPWWLYKEQLAGKLDFPRGYHIETAGSRRMPNVGSFGNLERLSGVGYGRRLKDEARRYYGSSVAYSGRGEMIPNDDCFTELDPTVKDRWGIPVLRFHWKWSEYEYRQAAHMQRTFAEIIATMGGTPGSLDASGREAIAEGGRIIHEVGGAIMGSDRKKSVTNRHSQCWDAPNVYVTDGASFCSNSDKNPTLTIMALAWRAADHMIAEMKKGNLR